MGLAAGVVSRVCALAFAALCIAAVPARPAGAQNPPTPDRIRQQREELDRVRKERADLEARMRDLKSKVHDLSEERGNLDRQADATARVVRGLDQQILSLADEEADATARVVETQDELTMKKAILRYRVREIYKRGGMYTLEALLSARTFGELLARYKYLHLVALRDRALVDRVASLDQEVALQRSALVRLRNDAETSRQDKSEEERRLRALEQQRGRSLAQAESNQQEVATRLEEIARTEARLATLLSTLEEARRRSNSAPGSSAPSVSSLRTSDLGRLDWPVDGTILYKFGRLVNPNNTLIRWNGIGIAAAAGTPVKAVSSGTVEYADRFGTYGLMVVISHGGGALSIYGSLGRATVTKDMKVAKGQVIGTVGTSDPDLDPHLHFEIRPEGKSAVDPLDWLRRQP